MGLVAEWFKQKLEPRSESVKFMSSCCFQKNVIITQLAMFYLLLCFDHHRQPSSGTECSVVTAR